MQPQELIRRALRSENWALAQSSHASSEIVERVDALCLLPSYDIYIVRGAFNQFDFPSLPSGSYGYYAANGREAFQLTRRHKEIERLLRVDWAVLPTLSPCALAGLVLPFYDGGIKERHRVLSGVEALEQYRANRHYELDENQMSLLPTQDLIPSIEATENRIHIRVLTLRGWMHRKVNLGVETITIESDGRVSLDQRKVWSEKIFRRIPHILY